MKGERDNFKWFLETACYLFLKVDDTLNIQFSNQIRRWIVFCEHCRHIEKIKTVLFRDHQKQFRLWDW